ncbi:MAG: hypothetical protein J5701_03295 [Bacteroidales bacterium]|nr:hypothetical protein [Bacteroidales bacterium]
MKRFCIILMVMISMGNANSQEKILPYTQVCFGINPTLNSALHITSQTETSYLKSRPTVNGELNIGIRQRIWKNLSAKVAFGCEIFRFHHEYQINSGSLSKKFKSTDYFNGAVTIPISLQYETMCFSKVNFFAEAGVKLHILFESFSYYIVSVVNEDMVEVYQSDMYSGKKSLLVSGFAKAGILFSTPKAHSFIIAVTANYCPQRVFKGTYTFNNISDEYGDLSMGINNIGLEFVYCLPVWRK